MDLAIVAVCIGVDVAAGALVVIGVSAVPIVVRSLANEMRDGQMLHGHQDENRQ